MREQNRKIGLIAGGGGLAVAMIMVLLQGHGPPKLRLLVNMDRSQSDVPVFDSWLSYAQAVRAARNHDFAAYVALNDDGSSVVNLPCNTLVQVRSETTVTSGNVPAVQVEVLHGLRRGQRFWCGKASLALANAPPPP